MKKVILTLLLISLFSKSCLAIDDFDYGVNKTTDISFNETILIEDEGEQSAQRTTFDFVPLFNRSIIVPIKENVSALIRSFCNMCSGGYDLTTTILETYCENNGSYSITVTAANDSLTADSVNGSAVIGIPEGEFSAYINNNDDTELSCSTYLMGVGSDTTPEEGYNINLTCYDKLPDGKKTNFWYWLGPVIGVVGAAGLVGAGFGTYKGLEKADIVSP